MRLAGGHVLLCALVLGAAFGCASDISVAENPPEDRQLYGADDLLPGHLSPGTINLLGNFLLTDLCESDPAETVVRLEELLKKEKSREILCALADVVLYTGLRLRSDPDTASRYFLAAAAYSGYFLKELDDGKNPYDEERIRLIRICNLATTELFCYLKERHLERGGGFELSMPGVNRQVHFASPVYQLPVSESTVAEFTPCADYRPQNLTHVTRTSGFGVPLIAELKPNSRDIGGVLIQEVPLTVTLVPDFAFDTESGRATAVFRYIYSRTADQVKLGKHTLPLCTDFSTPLAKAVSRPPVVNFLKRTFEVSESSKFTGLYHFEPFDADRIPVVFVHGLMSDARTWGQMLNTLLQDRDIRKKYQFLGFAYSSGSPVFSSGAVLRRELQKLRDRLVREKRSTAAFDRMVLVGHSMGGLLSRLQISGCSKAEVAAVLNLKDLDEVLKKFPAASQRRLAELSEFKPLPSVKRVIFIAVPHRGSRIADSWVGELGASLIRLPGEVVRRNIGILQDLVRQGKVRPDFLIRFTGIDNLRPDDPMLRLLGTLPMAKVPYHSIIGNRERWGTPGGSDGVVPYESSHLDGAESELVVKSGHSVHRNPLAIQEVRRILREHAGCGREASK